MKNKEKGVALIVTFFIMTILLAIVLGVSIIIYSEIKIIKSIGNSVIAFYAADSGVEEALYHINKDGSCAAGCQPFTGSLDADNKITYSVDVSSNLNVQSSGSYIDAKGITTVRKIEVNFQ